MVMQSVKTMTITERRTSIKQMVVLPAPSTPLPQPAEPLGPDGRGYPVLKTVKLSPWQKQTDAEFTWKDVAKHNTAASAWISVGTSVYDITSFIDSHPGGRHVLLLAAGRDATDLIRSYHPFTDKPYSELRDRYIGRLTVTEFPQFADDTGFFAEARAAVGAYFKQNKLDYKDPTKGLTILATLMSIAAVCYAIIVYGGGALPLSLRTFAAFVFGIVQALPLLHCMHDASHTSIGRHHSTWQLLGKFTMDWFAGASLNSWHNQHVLGHHVYTNVMGVDPDLPMTRSGDIRRVCSEQTWASYYRFQHIYLCILYGVLAIKFRIQDITGMLTMTNGAIRVNDLGWSETLSQVISKLTWVSWRVLIPIFYFNVNWFDFWSLFLLSEFVTGYYLTFNFQVSHVSPVVDFPSVHQTSFKHEWAIAQLQSTVDYAHDDDIVTFLCGALNYQSIHHLFPSISQYYYPNIAPIIQKIAKKHQIRYNYVGSFSDAFSLHLQHLHQMGINLDTILSQHH